MQKKTQVGSLGKNYHPSECAWTPLRHLTVLLTFLCLLLLGAPAIAQTPDPSQTSHAQLLRYYQQAKASGMTDMEIERAAMARGFTLDDIAKLRQRLESAQIEGNRPGEVRDTLGTKRDRIIPRITDQPKSKYPIDPLEPDKKIKDPTKDPFLKDPFSETQQRIFGASIFQNAYLTFEPNLRLATPKNYILGPDDELIVDIYGNSVDNLRLKVSPEGTVKMMNLAPVYVNGLSIEQATERIVNRLRQAYSSLNRPGSGTYANLTLGNVRTINVIVTGEVVRPGSYSVSSLATAFNALYASGGPTENGSFRKIEVVRNNNVVAKIDLYPFIVDANLKNNITLQDQDIIMVYPYQARVELMGEVKHPGIFEAGIDDTFQDMIRYAGGFTSLAYTAAIRYKRNTGKEYKLGLITTGQAGDLIPKDGDQYVVGEILDRYENRVRVQGAVYRPGLYALEEGTQTVRELIRKAEGLQEDAFTNRALIRRKNDLLETEILSFDLGRLMRGELSDIPLRREDELIIKSVKDLQSRRTVSIQGEVNFAEEYPFAEGMTIADLIFLAGGYSEGAIPYRIDVARRNKSDSLVANESNTTRIFTLNLGKDLHFQSEDQRFELMPFDIVFVRKATGYEDQKTIIIEGEVMYPGRYAILNNTERISNVIQRAGGLKPNAYLAGARLIRQITRIEQEDSKLLEAVSNTNLTKLPPASVEARQAKKDSIKQSSKSEDSKLVGLDLVSIMKNPNQPANILVQGGDSILIPRRVETVRIIGEVLNPSLVNYDPTFSFNDYISQAGGYTDNARRHKVFVSYANGRVDRTKRILFFNNRPEVTPGTTINVPTRLAKTGPNISPAEKIAILSLISTLVFTVFRMF